MKKCNIGGQAVLEGVMMKGPDKYAVAVRTPDKKIEVLVKRYQNAGDKHAIFRVPIIRGVVNFIESLYIGMKTLMDSADFLEEEEDSSTDSDKKKDTKSTQNSKVNAANKKVSDKKTSDRKDAKDVGYIIGTLAISLVLAIGLFMLLPAFLATFLEKVTDSVLLINLCEGVLRLAIFLIYVVAISKMEDINRTYMYHGAEHKTINCLEAGVELTPENVQKFTRFHKRCGTSFLVIVMIISIIVFMFVHTDTMWMKLLSRVLLVPVIAGLSYEVIRFAGRSKSKLAEILSIPGVWLQHITTKEPDLEMIEVAIKSVEAVIDWKEYINCVNNDCFEK